jgi:hypothetical protein
MDNFINIFYRLVDKDHLHHEGYDELHNFFSIGFNF